MREDFMAKTSIRHAEITRRIHVFVKKLAAPGIYSVRHRDHGPKEAYYDGLLLRDDIKRPNEALI